MNNPAHLARLRWQCRRGMLELDVLVMRFFEKSYLQLPVDEQATFERLLNCNDQQLFEWLMGYEQPEDIAFCKMVEKIRSLN